MELEMLVMQSQQGDERAFCEVYQRFMGLVYKMARQQHVRPIYEEAVCAGQLALVEAIREYSLEQGVSFSAFAYQKVKFAVWNLFKKERRRWQMELSLSTETGEESTLADFISDSYDFTAAVESGQIFEVVCRKIELLPEKQRRVLKLLFMEGKNLTQAANGLGVSVQAVASLRNRALKRLKEMMGCTE